ncbi:hypothetical protein CBG25_02945 [Arsenophonus sp. ENCA]|nr:hypothetical protein CBG25_02945 [Arsenophonus sp. ENCA]
MYHAELNLKIERFFIGAKLVVERTKAGLAAARSRGRIGGRPQSLSFAQQQEALKLLANGHSRKQLALLYGVSLASIYKYFPVNQ